MQQNKSDRNNKIKAFEKLKKNILKQIFDFLNQPTVATGKMENETRKDKMIFFFIYDRYTHIYIIMICFCTTFNYGQFNRCYFFSYICLDISDLSNNNYCAVDGLWGFFSSTFFIIFFFLFFIKLSNYVVKLSFYHGHWSMHSIIILCMDSHQSSLADFKIRIKINVWIPSILFRVDSKIRKTKTKQKIAIRETWTKFFSTHKCQ